MSTDAHDPVTDRRVIRRSIRTRLAAFVGIIAGGGLLALALPSWLFLHDRLHQHAQDRLWSDAMGRREALQSYIQHQKDRIELVASRTRLRELIAERLDGTIPAERFRARTRQILEHASAGVEDVQALWITDPLGRVMTATDESMLGRDLSSTEAFRRGSRAPYVGLPEPGQPGHAGLVAAPARLDDRLVGIVMGRVDHERLAGLLTAFKGSYQTFAIRVGSREGDQVRFHFADDPERASAPSGSAPAMAEAIAGRAGFAQTHDPEGREVLTAYLPTGVDAYGLVASVEVDEAYAAADQFLMRSLLTAAVVFAIALVASHVLASRFTRPIRTLSDVARAFAAARLDARADVRTGDEVEALAAVFNEMAASLQSHQERLEDLVRQRTADLEREISRRAEAEQRFRSVAKSAPDALVTGDESGRITYFNRAAERMFGWDDGERVVGQPLTVLMPERLRAGHERGLERHLATGEMRLLGKTTELVGLRRNGEEFPVEVSLSAWTDRDGRRAFTGILRDVTQRRQIEEALRRARIDAEAASRAKSEFLASVSHEIRTPMNGILGMADLLLGMRLEPIQRDYADTIRRSAETLLRLLNDILDLSRIEAGRLELEEVPFSLRETLGDTLQALAVRAAEKGLELVYHIPPEVIDGLRGDPIRLRQVVVNLVGNAVKFTDEGEVVVRVVEESRDDDHVTLRCSVTDTGPGVPEAVRDRIFEAFEQGEASMDARFGGTGLGLAIASRLVRAMGGRIWLESEVGRGSTFRFTARLRRCPQAASDKLARPQSLRGLRVLVVDDNATNRLVLTELLRSWDMSPVPAASGPEALAAIERALVGGESVQIALLDSQLPDMDGFELAARIREDPRLRDLPLLMLSSAGRTNEVMRSRALGIGRCMTKPVKQSDLLEAIQREVSDGERLVAAAGEDPDVVSRPLRVLVAEDDPVNQKVAQGLLERRGHAVTLVENGRLALEALERESFDVVLMDVRMPEVNGLDATRALRERERTTGEHVAVVAMTAHAMKGDRDACLEAGMDDYVSKPVHADELYRVVEHAARTGRGRPRDETRASIEEATGLGSGGWDDAVLRLGASEETLRTVAGVFLDEVPRLRTRIGDAVIARDAGALRDAAHRAKGSLIAVGAEPAARLAHRIERMGESGDLTGVEDAWRELESQLGRVAAALELRLGHERAPEG